MVFFLPLYQPNATHYSLQKNADFKIAKLIDEFAKT